MGNYAYLTLLNSCRFQAVQNLATLQGKKSKHVILAHKRYSKIKELLDDLLKQVINPRDLFSAYTTTVAPWDIRLSTISDLVQELGGAANDEGKATLDAFFNFRATWERLIQHFELVLPCSPWWYRKDKAKQMTLLVEEMNQILLDTAWPQEFDSLIRVNMRTLSSYLLHGGEEEQKSHLIFAREKLMAIIEHKRLGTELKSYMAFARLLTVIVAVLEGRTLEKATRSVIVWTNGNAQL